MARPDPDERAEQLDRLGRLGRGELREEWRRLCRSPPPNLSRDLLVRALAYRIQELAEGGLPRAILRRLLPAGSAEQEGGTAPRTVELDLRPGAHLVREWHGRTHTVTVTETGFEHQGQHYRSLSTIARQITGTRWSGPRFFAPTRRGGARPHG